MTPGPRSSKPRPIQRVAADRFIDAINGALHKKFEKVPTNWGSG